MFNKKDFAFHSIHQPSVVEQIIETFKTHIMKGELRPGQRLPSETELSQQLGVGRSAVREAMKILEAMGVVTIQQGNGTFISDKPSSKLLNPLMFAIMLEAGMALEFYELRYTTQVGYCELAAEKATEADWQAIETAATALEKYVENPDYDFKTLCDLDLQFHYAILDATHNPLIIKIGRTVEELFFNSFYTSMSGSGNIVRHHQIIMNGLRDGSPQAIRQAVATSLDYWKKEVEKQDV
jgi:GntR family transcriptional repressor for pyruvate dehydrogenase complex